MTKSPNDMRKANGIRWSCIWLVLDPVKCCASKQMIVRSARRERGAELIHWLCEGALCEAMCRAKGLQTDIEDFCPTTQSERRVDAPAQA